MNNAIFIMLNSNHFHYTVAFLNSLTKNWGTYPTILCHHTNDLTQEQINKLKTYSRLKLLPLDLNENEVGKVPSHKSHGMLVSYGRLRIWSPVWEHLYAEYDNILYIDIDTLVLKPLDELINKSEFTIFRAENKLDFEFTPQELRGLLEEDGLSTFFDMDFTFNGITGNAGVMVIPKYLRTEENYNYLMYLLNRYKKYNRLADQAIVNLWMIKNQIKTDISSVKFNFLTFFLNPKSTYWNSNNVGLEEEFSKIHVMHFVIKPEQITNCPYIEYSDESLKYCHKAAELFNFYLNYSGISSK